MKKGLVIVYIGDGKGKTTAAVGLAVRAAGAGKRVLFCQFVKAATATASGEWPLSSEIEILKGTSGVTVQILGRGFVGILGDTKDKEVHKTAAQEGLEWLQLALKSGDYDLVIADELITGVEVELLTVAEILGVIQLAREKMIPLALTGHNKYNE